MISVVFVMLRERITMWKIGIYKFKTLSLKDGGCTCPGDIAKAIGAGADFVMLGGMLAGHDQSGGEVIEKDGRKRKLFYGMSSSTAMKKHKVNFVINSWTNARSNYPTPLKKHRALF